jgi:hypothetical protein
MCGEDVDIGPLGQVLLTNYRRKKEQFDSIFDPEVHNSLVARSVHCFHN